MIESLPEDYEIRIYSCSKITHRWHVTLWKIIDQNDMDKNTELLNLKCISIDYGLGLLEEYINGEAFAKRVIELAAT